MDFLYTEKENQIEITGYTGKDADVAVPGWINEKPVQSISAKAFLSQTGIRKLTLPDTIVEIGDWAFCHMKNLEKLTLCSMPGFGRQVFKGCQVKEIEVAGLGEPGAWKLVAAGITFWKESFEVLQEAFEKDSLEIWLSGYDEALLLYLNQPDDIGFVPGFVGWFDDSDVDVEREKYCALKRTEKGLLALERLCYDKALSDKQREAYTKYLFSQSRETLLSVVCGEVVSHNVDYVKTFERHGGCKAVDVGILLEAMRDADPEVTAFLLSIKAEEGEAFFESLAW